MFNDNLISQYLTRVVLPLPHRRHNFKVQRVLFRHDCYLVLIDNRTLYPLKTRTKLVSEKLAPIMLDTNLDPLSLEDILYVLNHVFLPPQLPQEDDSDRNRDIVLSHLVYNASIDFVNFLLEDQRQKWSIVTQMLRIFLETTQRFHKERLVKNILQMKDAGQFCRSLQSILRSSLVFCTCIQTSSGFISMLKMPL
jgi:hypothetical protein